MGWMSTAIPKQQLICCGHWQVWKKLTRLREIQCLLNQYQKEILQPAVGDPASAGGLD